jgi:uncharacterized protein
LSGPAFGQSGQQPFRQFLLKIVSRCNLACDYCYVYEYEDQGWRHRPRVMPDKILRATVDRIVEHTRAHRMAAVQVIFHGGEPLLAGADYLEHAAQLLRTVEETGTRVDLSVQTNGLLLDDRFLDVFHRHRIRVGVSLDGDARTHDRHRRRRDGTASSVYVTRALRILNQAENRALFSGLLGVVDLDADPLAYYEAMIAHEPAMIDLLLPHGSWTQPPPRLAQRGESTPYADWLIAVFERWFDAPRRETGIRLFESIIKLWLGGQTGSESLGLAPIDLVTVETDGAIEQVDTLKVTGAGAAATGLHVLQAPFDAALRYPGIAARQLGIDALATECRRCDLVDVCGGGLYTHRYRDGTFTHPSVYCWDLYRLITHVGARVDAAVAAIRPNAVGGR